MREAGVEYCFVLFGGGGGVEHCFAPFGARGGGRVLLCIASTVLLYVHTPFG